MKTIAEALRNEIAEHGDEVHLANAEATGWFAITPTKWENLVDRAKREGRDGPTLVVYKTATTDPRDHWVIPYQTMQPLLTDDAAPFRKDGKRRWELTLIDHQLHVTNREGAIDVKAYHGLPLPGEWLPAAELLLPTADPAELERRVAELRRLPLTRPTGRHEAARVTRADQVVYQRRADVKAWVFQEADGRCELCLREAPFTGREGNAFLELHHVRQLALGGTDAVENAVALCPNCHRRLHHGSTVEDDLQRLYRQVSRLIPE